jgi:hypothetical protein
MPEGLAERVPTPTRIPQGSSLSPILYLFYNAGLIEACIEQKTKKNIKIKNLKQIVAYSWINNISYLATSMSKKELVAKLQIGYYKI